MLDQTRAWSTPPTDRILKMDARVESLWDDLVDDVRGGTLRNNMIIHAFPYARDSRGERTKPGDAHAVAKLGYVLTGTCVEISFEMYTDFERVHRTGTSGAGCNPRRTRVLRTTLHMSSAPGTSIPQDLSSLLGKPSSSPGCKCCPTPASDPSVELSRWLPAGSW